MNVILYYLVKVCGIERKVDINGAVVFNTGCMTKNTCQTSPAVVNGIQECYHCCSTDLCNSYGCGEQDISTGNGTMCYNCLGALKRDDCQYVTFCDNSKMCYIEERTHFGEAFYNSGCKEKHVCETQYQFNPIIGRRRSTTQFSCCGSQLCNNGGHAISTTSLPDTITEVTTLNTTSTTQAACSSRYCLYDGYCQKGNPTCICRGGHFGEFCQYADGKGTRFLLIFHQGCGSYCTTSYYMPSILVASNTTAHLSVCLFNGNQIKSVSINRTSPTSDLDGSVIPNDGIHNAGAEISSDVKVTVYGFILQQTNDVSEGFLVIPTRYLSTRYIIPMYTVLHSGVITISPLYSNTYITIHLRLQSGSVTYKGVKYSDNDSINITLNKYSTFQLRYGSDMSGTLVSSSREVAVMSGNICNKVYGNVSGSDCQPFIEMVLPTNQLDHFYIIPSIATRKNSIVRIQAINSTNVTIQSDNKQISRTIIHRNYYDFHHSEVSYISSSEDILVMIYPVELSSYHGDAFMMTIHGVNQYLSEYDFVVPTQFTSFISVTVPSDSVDGFIIDGKSAANRSSIFSISNGIYHFSTFNFPISSGAHHIEHNKHIRFGLWVNGNSAWDAYGYPAGVAFK